MHLVASLYEHLLDFTASSKILQRWISLCFMQTKYISNSQGHNEIDSGNGFLWKIIFCFFRFHEATLSLDSFSSTVVYPNFDNVFFFLHTGCPLKVPSFFFFSAPLSYLQSYKHEDMFHFYSVSLPNIYYADWNGIWFMMFASVQQTSLTIFNSFQPSPFIVLLYFVSDYEITCTWGMFSI